MIDKDTQPNAVAVWELVAEIKKQNDATIAAKIEDSIKRSAENGTNEP